MLPDDHIRFRSVWTTILRSRHRRSRYCIRWIDDQGTERQRCFPTRQMMQTARRLREIELNSWSRPPEILSWPELIANFALTLTDRSRKYQERIALTLGRFEKVCGPVQSNQLSRAHCEAFIAARARGEPALADGSTPIPASATRRGDHQFLTTFFRWAVSSGYLTANPMEGVHKPPLPRRTKRAPAEEDWLRLLRALNEPSLQSRLDDAQAWHLLILLAITTGYRQAVLMSTHFGASIANDSQIEAIGRGHPRGYALVELASAEEYGLGCYFTYTGKTLKETITAIPAVVTDRIARRISDLPDGTVHLFPWTAWPRKAWSRITAAAGLAGLRFHALRAVSGTQAAIARAAASGADQLDHSSPAVTRRHYLDPAAVARAVAIAQLLPELPPMPAYAPVASAALRHPSTGRSAQS